ncbi:MAG: Uma2 family endonuclease [Acidobacteriota bacterium]
MTLSLIRALIITESNIQRAPDLVIEILSPGTRRTDEVIKRKLYERSGVDEY